MQTWLMVLLVSMFVLSIVSLAIYAWDKRQAVRSRSRISEKSLHVLALLGGWPGATLAQRWLRHKSVKRRFRLIYWLTIVGHVAVTAVITYFIWQIDQ